ncbi:MAG: DUF4390 domain-containing protein [Burkholderiaceae bacterium]
MRERPTAARQPVRGRRLWLRAAALAVASVAGLPHASPVRAQPAGDAIETRQIRLEPAVEGDAFMLWVDFAIALPPRLEEAVNKGVPLSFVVEAELFEPRWYWMDDKIVSSVQTYRLSFHALSRQYRVHANGQQQNFGDLADALAALGKIRDWRFVEAERIHYGKRYEGQMRIRLDPSQLPKPFQVTALTSKDWTLQTEWKRFEFKP